MADAVNSAEFGGSFLFSTVPSDAFDLQKDASALTARADEKDGRALIWGEYRLSFSNGAVNEAFNRPVRNDVYFSVNPGTSFVFDGSGSLSFTALHMGFSNMQDQDAVGNVSIPLRGDASGLFLFLYSPEPKLFTRMFPVGFDFGYPENENPASVSYPFASSLSVSSDYVKFKVSMDFCQNASEFAFYDTDKVKPLFLTYYLTVFGENLLLAPKEGASLKFVPNAYPNAASAFAPAGDYVIHTDNGSHKNGVLCGLNGTEYFIPPESGLISFEDDHSAFAPKYPPSPLSIDDFVNASGKIPLTDIYKSSWVKFASGTKYFSHPSKSPYYGRSQNGGILAAAPLCRVIGADCPAFALVPVSGANSVGIDYESAVISAARGAVLGDAKNAVSLFSDGLSSVAAPTGYILKISGGNVSEIILSDEISFKNPAPQLVSAFNTSGMFLVASNNSLIKYSGSVSISGFSLNLEIGKGSGYNDYKCVLIVKSRKGKIYDPDDEKNSLCSNTSSWTNASDFAAPSDGTTANLAVFLRGYFADRNGKDPFLSNIITDENWRGFIFVNIPLSPANFPDALRPVLPANGVTLEYIGASNVPLKIENAEPVSGGAAKYFGYASYQKQGYTDKVLPPDKKGEFEFTPLEIKAVFRNGALTDFKSTAQLVFANFLGITPNGGCLYSAVLMEGAYMDSGGVYSYQLRAVSDNTLNFKNDALSSVLLKSVVLSDSGAQKTFTITGEVKFTKNEKADVWSYDALLFGGYRLVQENGGFSEDVSSVTFDIKNSLLRENSLFKSFGITPLKFEALDGDVKGFDDVICDYFGGAGKGARYAVSAAANIGGTGDLSGNSPISVNFLFGFDAGGTFAALSFPKTLNIENVINLTTGTAKLTYDGAFSLNIYGVSLKAFGLLKLPAAGSVSLGIFGENNDKPGWYALYKK
jgi:hypothetical protein